MAALPDQELLDRHYPGGAPIIIKVGFRHGYGPALVELNRKVYFNDQLAFSREMMEAIQGIVLSHCENEYCLVMHMRGLIAAGFSLEEIEQLVAYHKLPDRVPDSLRWQVTLQRISTLCREPRLAVELYDSLRELHDEHVVDDIAGVVAFSLLHKFLLEAYSAEIVIEEEPILFATIDCGAELIKAMKRHGSRKVPMFTLCCVCKAIKGHSGWMPIERAIAEIPGDTVFSHGFCEECVQQYEY